MSRISQVVNMMEAGELVAQGEWMFDTAAMDQIHEHAQALRSKVAVQDPTQREWLSSDEFHKTYGHVYEAVDHLLQDRFDHRVINEPIRHDEWATSQIRIRPNTVLKVGSALGEISEGLALIFSVFTVTPLAFWAKVILGKQLANVIKRLLKCWEVLTDPDERLVFEAVFRLQGKRSFEILKLVDRSEASMILESDVAGLCVEVGSSLSEREVVKALTSLERRGILSERDSRWHIVF